MNIGFYRSEYDKKAKKISIEGVVFYVTENRPLPYVTIFLGKLKEHRIMKMKILKNALGKSPEQLTTSDTGRFKSTFKMRRGWKLYFLHPDFFLVEFDTERLNAFY